MNRIDQLLENYKSHLQMPLRPNLPSQRVWFAVYPESEERRLICRLDEFEMATKAAGHPWVRIDLSGCLARWLETVDELERPEWFKNPGAVELYAKSEWRDLLVRFIQESVVRAPAPERTIFAVTGLMELYDLLHVSDLIEGLEHVVPGFLLVFFPGEREDNTYRFLNARVGWNYMAIPILSGK